MVRTFIALMLLLTPLHAARAQEAPKPIELGDFGGRLRSIRLIVNGQEGLFTIDTGGGVSLISPEFAKKIGCRPWAAHTGFRLSGERLEMPRCEDVTFQLPMGDRLRPVAAGVLDLKPLLFKDAPLVDGSIALDAFEGRIFTLDLGKGTLEWRAQPRFPRARTAIEIPMRSIRQAGGAALGVAVAVPTKSGQLCMALDSGGVPRSCYETRSLRRPGSM